MPLENEQAVLTAYPLEAAKKIEPYLLAKAAGTRALLDGDGIVDDLVDGGPKHRAAVHQLDRPRRILNWPFL